MLELLLVQKFTPFVLADLRPELRMLEKFQMVQRMRVPGTRWSEFMIKGRRIW